MPELWGIILAAGESRRMNEPKLLMQFHGKTMIEKVIDIVSRAGINNILLVLGSGKNEILDVIGKLKVSHCYNENFKQGMLSSIKCGIRSLPEELDAMLIFPGDQPLIPVDAVREVIQAYKQSGKGILIPVYRQKRGHPILIDRKYSPEIEKLDDREGLRSLALKYPDEVYEVEVYHDGILRDIDTKEDYLHAIQH